MTSAPNIPGVHPQSTSSTRAATGLLAYLLAGLYFGAVLVKSEAASWYRIQEMFRFEAFHMFGLIGSAVLTEMVTTMLLRRSGLKSRDGQTIQVTAKAKGWRRYVFGGLTFGVGWGLAGVCPRLYSHMARTGDPLLAGAVTSPLHEVALETLRAAADDLAPPPGPHRAE